jgi:hypothetical protein
MSVPTLHSITERLASMERIELEELAFEYVKSHAAVCRLAAGGDQTEPHADDTTISQRVGSMSSAGLAAMLAPAAFVSVSAHELWSHE